MAYQKLSLEDGKVQVELRISGSDMLGMKVNAPLGLHPQVHVLPMLHVNVEKVLALSCFPFVTL